MFKKETGDSSLVLFFLKDETSQDEQWYTQWISGFI